MGLLYYLSCDPEPLLDGFVEKTHPESVYLFVAVEGRSDEEQTLSLALWQMIEKSSEGA